MPSRYSEEEAVQKPAGDLLSWLGWDVMYCYDEEVLGSDGTLGRTSHDEVILKRYLRNAIGELNLHLEDEEITHVISVLEEALSTDDLLQTNEKKYQLLRDGVPIERTSDDGTTEVEFVKIFDYDNPENNYFLACEELWVQGDLYHKRCDLVGFVNGIPLLFVEFKRHDKDVLRAFEDNYTDYLDTIPHLFYLNAFIMLSNGLEARVGALGSSYDFFHEWNRISEEDDDSPGLQTMLLGMCNKTAFLDIFENFIMFDKSQSPTAKILARNHQYMGVNNTVAAYENRRELMGKLGVFWHTQGSGKSYSMVFLARKILRKFEGSPTFLVVTDREELDKQIAATFAGCGCLASASGESYTATSAERLEEMLQGNPPFIFTLIQKFRNESTVPIISDHDVIIFSDEAHRTNNGIFAENMCRLLPEASRIGFTGTPLLAHDNITTRTFGNYVSIYDFRQAVIDGSTVPLYYENRSNLLGIENPELDERLAEAVENADLNPDQEESVERKLRDKIHIIMAKPRLKRIARDFVEHYSGIWETGKAMFVCVNKVTTVLMLEYVQEYWEEEIASLESGLSDLSGDELIYLQSKIEWMRSTEMAVVISKDQQNEVSQFRNWGLDIRPHRQKMNVRNLEKDFKDAGHPFRIVFVCAMWLTGFDVKPLSAMYFDKPLKAHTLMQAIARANRVSKGKSNGLIIDYIGVVGELRDALAAYTVNRRNIDTDPVYDKGELLARIGELANETDEFVNSHGFSVSALSAAEGFDKLELIQEGANALSATDDIKKEFCAMARDLGRMLKYVSWDEVPTELVEKQDAIRALLKQLTKKYDVADTGAVMAQLQRIVDGHITVVEATGSDEEALKIDISSIDFDRLRNEFIRVKDKNLLINELRSVIEDRLESALRLNPRRIGIFNRYQEIIAEYNREQDKARIEKTFEDLMRLSGELDEAQQSYIKEGFTCPQQQAVFDMLFRDDLAKEEINQVKALSIELTDTIEARLNQMVQWTAKQQTQAEVRRIIRDMLYSKLAEDYYTDEAIAQNGKEIFNYFYVRDKAA
ncbi:MAG: type I restriction endonuclease subunit R [Coriobacteriia bacterium]|nr:type I restriction endonuclease subunit R [Coriobacteriia bacterium]